MFKYQPKTKPKQCQWFSTCDECHDNNSHCLIPDTEYPLRYDSDQALRARVRRVKRFAALGMALPEIAEYFNVAEETIQDWLNSDIGQTVRQTAEEIRDDVCKMRRAGCLEKQLAVIFGVALPTVRKAYKKLDKKYGKNENSMTPRQRQELPRWAGGTIREGGKLMGVTQAMLNTLTQREFNTFCLIGFSKPDKEIAAELGVSTDTVDRHIKSIKRKLKLRGRTRIELFLLASMFGVVSPKKVEAEMCRRLGVHRKTLLSRAAQTWDALFIKELNALRCDKPNANQKY